MTAPDRVSTPTFRVLVVDDDPDMQRLLALMIRAEGMQVDTADDGDAALTRAAATPPDLILLDVMLPGIDGFAVCERLKRDAATAMIPIVLITGLEDRASRVRGIRAGADDFLSKPVQREELLARVQTLRVAVVVLFADLRGFTRLTERTQVDGVVALLNEYFEVLTEAAYRHDGTIFNMAGDNLLVGFNVPFAQPDAAALAWRAAHDMAASARPVLERWAGRGMATGVGFGIAPGDAILGNIGSSHYMNYTIIGDAVNVAARLVELAQPGELLVSGAVLKAAGQKAAGRGMLPLRGRSEPVDVYSAML